MKRFNLGPIVKKLRQQKGLTQRELADSLGCKKARVSKIESGALDINLYTTAKLSILFGKKFEVFGIRLDKQKIG